MAERGKAKVAMPEVTDPQVLAEARSAWWTVAEWLIFHPLCEGYSLSLYDLAQRVEKFIASEEKQVQQCIEEFKNKWRLPKWSPTQDLPPSPPGTPGSRRIGGSFHLDVRLLDSIHARQLQEQCVELTRQLRYALVVMAFSEIERRLNEARDLLSFGSYPTFRKCFLKEYGLHGRDGALDEAMTFLQEVVQLKFPLDSDEWNELKMLQVLRNVIVHSEGKPKRESDERVLQGYARKRKDLLSFDAHGQIQIGAGFMESVLKQIDQFLVLWHDSNRRLLAELRHEFVELGPPALDED